MANDDRTLAESFIGASPFLIKVLELVVALLCLVLIYVPFDNRLQTNLNHVGIVYVTYCCAVIVNGVLIGSHLQGERVPQKTLFIFSTVLGILFFITGCVVLNDWWTLMHSLYFHPPKTFLDMMICSGIFSILNSLTFFTDIWLTYRYG
ncbi:uncharacterized protein LOC128993393 [Macrosteles quadrilineatus]|uniref:uncharacterized protein LOC128993393 n=1 Tax=Macrosteles quadrilineatus TaxID=74068 RepID=UPI0023E0CD22|nr:uncharacterized protein LOC128993393 [Macrosteles quadrilineatus]